MAKTAKSSHGSAKTLKKTKAVAPKTEAKAPKKAPAVEASAKKKPVATAAVAKPPPQGASVADPKKKPGEKGNGMFARPAMRRGRRPKALADYQPANNEEEDYKEEFDYRGLEYDTGIRVNKAKDDSPFNMERFDDYDEELNFDF